MQMCHENVKKVSSLGTRYEDQYLYVTPSKSLDPTFYKSQQHRQGNLENNDKNLISSYWKTREEIWKEIKINIKFKLKNYHSLIECISSASFPATVLNWGL